MPFHVKFNVFRVSHGCVMCRAVSPEGAAAGGPERGHRPTRVPKSRDPHPAASPSPPVPPLRLAGKFPAAEEARRNGKGRKGEGSAPGNCGGRVRRADYLYSLPVFMGCPVRHRTRSRCVGAVQDYLWGRAAPGGCLLSAFLHLPVNCQFIALQRGAGGGKALD